LRAGLRSDKLLYVPGKEDTSRVSLSNLLDGNDLGTISPRQRILAAALKLFVEQGYFNTNVPDLSRLSKCSVGSIYHTFKNKEEIASALYAEGISAFRKALEESLGAETDPAAAIKTVVRSFLLFSEINHQFSKYLWLSRHHEFMSTIARHPSRVGFDGLGRTLTKMLKDGIRNKKLRPLKANVLWSILFGVPLAYVRDWLDGYNPEPPSKVADDLAEACWRALRVEP
jgi:TetR/AcrR family transcriptional regulator, repressor of fatR-cypB operon